MVAGVGVAVWLTAAAFAFWISPAAAADPRRVVAVGDVHGSFEGLTAILEEAELIDEHHRWIGGTSILVQTGDLLDRGVHLQEVMDLLMSLQAEAPTAGGQVVVLLGNHEAMNLLAITRDVNRDAYATFVDDDSERRQADGWAAYKSFWRQRLAEFGERPVFSDETRQQWFASHPLGFFEYVEALGPEGRYGSWLRGLPTAAIFGDTLFIHGGYGPYLAGVSVDDINRRVADEIASFDRIKGWMVSEGLALPWYSVHQVAGEAQRELQWIAGQDPSTVSTTRLQRAQRLDFQWSSWYLVNPDGPLWFRGAARWTEEDDGALVKSLLDGLGVARQVVGHTPQRSARIQARVDNRVFLIDTGMLTGVYGGGPSALEIVGDSVAAIYIGDRQVLQQGTPAPAEAQATGG
jgi:hypothetical protein